MASLEIPGFEQPPGQLARQQAQLQQGRKHGKKERAWIAGDAHGSMRTYRERFFN